MAATFRRLLAQRNVDSREVGLRQTPEGIRLVQKPVREMRSLRARHYDLAAGDAATANDWLEQNQIQGNQLEFELNLEPQTSGEEGLQVFRERRNQETVVGVDRDRGTVFVDRTRSATVGFNPKYIVQVQRVGAELLQDAQGKLKFFRQTDKAARFQVAFGPVQISPARHQFYMQVFKIFRFDAIPLQTSGGCR